MLTFGKKLFTFQLFSKNYFLPQKTTASQTNFHFSNMGSNMHCFSCKVIWNKKFRFGSPCKTLCSTKILFHLTITVRWNKHWALLRLIMCWPLMPYLMKLKWHWNFQKTTTLAVKSKYNYTYNDSLALC